MCKLDDNAISLLFESVLEMYESVLSIGHPSMEKSETHSKIVMGIRSIGEDIFSINPSERNRDVVENAVRTFVEKQDVIFPEDEVQNLTNMMCTAFQI